MPSPLSRLVAHVARPLQNDSVRFVSQQKSWDTVLLAGTHFRGMIYDERDSRIRASLYIDGGLMEFSEPGDNLHAETAHYLDGAVGNILDDVHNLTREDVQYLADLIGGGDKEQFKDKKIIQLVAALDQAAQVFAKHDDQELMRLYMASSVYQKDAKYFDRLERERDERRGMIGYMAGQVISVINGPDGSEMALSKDSIDFITQYDARKARSGNDFRGMILDPRDQTFRAALQAHASAARFIENAVEYREIERVRYNFTNADGRPVGDFYNLTRAHVVSVVEALEQATDQQIAFDNVRDLLPVMQEAVEIFANFSDADLQEAYEASREGRIDDSVEQEQVRTQTRTRATLDRLRGGYRS